MKTQKFIADGGKLELRELKERFGIQAKAAVDSVEEQEDMNDLIEDSADLKRLVLGCNKTTPLSW